MTGWVMRLIYTAGYPSIVLLMFIENVFPPIPSELIMPLVGYLAGRGQFSFLGVVAAGSVGSVLGALPLYYLGRRLGAERLKEFADKYGRWLTLSRSEVERALDWFDRHGWAAVFFCRMVPGLRSFISLPAGVNQMNLPGFLACTAAGATLWTLLLAGLGYWLGGNYQKVEEYFDPIAYVLLGALVVKYVARLVRHKGQAREEVS